MWRYPLADSPVLTVSQANITCELVKLPSDITEAEVGPNRGYGRVGGLIWICV